MAKLSKGKTVIETVLPVEVTRLKAQGFIEVKQEKAAAAVASVDVSRVEAVKPALKPSK